MYNTAQGKQAAASVAQIKGAVASMAQVGGLVGEPKACYCCGSEGHLGEDCQHKETVCNHCSKRGYLARVCCSKPPQTGRQGSSCGWSQQATQWIGVEGQVAENLLEMPVLKWEGKGVPMEVDTGAAVSLISEVTQEKLFPQL